MITTLIQVNLIITSSFWMKKGGGGVRGKRLSTVYVTMCPLTAFWISIFFLIISYGTQKLLKELLFIIDFDSRTNCKSISNHARHLNLIFQLNLTQCTHKELNTSKLSFNQALLTFFVSELYSTTLQICNKKTIIPFLF